MRRVDLPAGGSVSVDLLISGAFTGWRGDPGTFEHWLRPALAWFRSADLDRVEHRDRRDLGRLRRAPADPGLPQPRLRDHPEEVGPGRGPALRREVGGDRLGLRPRPARLLLAQRRHLDRRRDGPRRPPRDRPRRSSSGWDASAGQNRPYAYWFQKYTIDGWPEWETPAIDQTAILPWGLEQHYRRTGDLDFVASCWPMVEQAAAVCRGGLGTPRPPLAGGPEPRSPRPGIWDNRYGAFLYSNASAVAGLRSAASLADAWASRRAGPALAGLGRPHLGRGHPRGRWPDRRAAGSSTARPGGCSTPGASPPCAGSGATGPRTLSTAPRPSTSACWGPPSPSASCPRRTRGCGGPPRRSCGIIPSAWTPTP